jgi:Tol biopolymer transport system component
MREHLEQRSMRRVGYRFALVSVLAASGRAAPGQTTDESLPKPEKAVFQQDVAWSPDGRWIAFSEYSGGEEYSADQWGVHVVKADGSQRRVIAENAIYVTWSPDGQRLAFGSRRDGEGDIYSVNVDGSDLRRLTEHDAKDITPAWSPKGDRIAFCSTRDGNEDIYLMNVDGSGVVRLTDDAAKDYNPAWSPDGRQIVFYREKGDRKDQVWVINADGSGARNLTHDDRHSVFPAFRPDGRIVFTCTEGDESGTIALDPSTGERAPVANVSGFFARLSPDGQRIAFIAGRWPRSAVYVIDAGGSVARKVVN